MRRLAIVLLCLPACTLNPYGGGPESESSTSDGPESATSTGTTIGGGTSTSDPSTSTGLDGTSTSTSTDGSSGTTGAVLMCGDSVPNQGGCPDGCSECDDGVCVLDCTVATGACPEVTLECPDGHACEVKCFGASACADSTVICPPDHDCHVVCNGPGACRNVDVMCGGGPCLLECETHVQSCSQTRFQCGSNVGSVTCNQPQDTPVTLHPSGSMCECTAQEDC